MALQFSVTAVGIMILQAYLNGFGSAVIAGYTAAGKVENLVTQPFTTLAAAMEVYCGQNYGAGRPDRIRQGIVSSLKMGGAAALGMLVLNVCFGRQMIRLFLEPYDPVIVEYGYTYLVIIGVFSMALCALQIVRSSLPGHGRSSGAHGRRRPGAGGPVGRLCAPAALRLRGNLLFHAPGLASGADAPLSLL